MSGTDTALDTPQQEVPLRRNRGFQLLWAGSVPAFLGRQMTDLVYPLVVLAITGSPGWAGAFGGVQIFTSLLFGIPAGELADRYDHRRLLLTVEAVRALVATSVVVAVLLDSLTLGHLLAVAVVIGAAQPLGGSTRTLLVRTLVPKSQLTAALTQEEVRSNSAALAGPPLGGFLYAVGHVVPFLVTAAGFVTAFLCTFFVRVPAGAAAPKRPADGLPVLRRMLVGLNALWSDPTLRAGMLFAAAMNLAGAPIMLVTVVQLRHQGVSSGAIGLATIGLAVGGLAGAALVGPLHRLLRPGILILSVAAAEAVLTALLALPWGPWWLAAVLFVLGLSGPSVRVLVDVLIFRQVPDEQRGRAISACMTVFGVGASIGVFGSGMLLQFLTPTVAILALAGILTLLAAAGWTSRSLRVAAWPEE
ncbi:MFS transporter [Kitasatospora sp. McL0602]|uniref:MFS transporter n=1 Tax=Kitasatospora sp. McL0602 TaxID=3439530 RepID=UPI003F8A2D27